MVNRYLRSYRRFIINSVSREMEYRFSFILKNISGLIWMFGAIFFINVIFSQVSSIAGWGKDQMLLLYLTFSFSIDFFNIFVMKNLEEFTKMVRKGDFDFFLLKPINLRFLTSLMAGRVEFHALFRFVLAFIILIDFALSHTFSLFNWFLYFFFVVTGMIALYSVIFALHTIVIWLIKLDNITHFSQVIFETSRVPLQSWPGIVQKLLIYIVPMGILSTFSINALFSQYHWTNLLIAPVVAVLLLIISNKFWKFALKHYSSASS